MKSNTTLFRRLMELSLLFSAGWLCAGHARADALTPVPARIVEAIKDSDTIRLVGNTHPMAKPSLDRGLVEPSRRLERMILVLQRSQAQELALTAFNEAQNDPFSKDYHHWLTAADFGAAYGPADADIAKVSDWLESHGFTIYQINEGKASIEFSGTVAQVQRTFQVQMHRYVVENVEHIANDRDPQIPRALASVVAGVASLNDFRPRSLTTWGSYVKRDRGTGKITPFDATPATRISPPGHAPVGGEPLVGVTPQLGYEGNDGFEHEDITPYDFATIYNVLPLWKAATPIIGTGVTVAIAGGSDIALSDIATYRKSFGLPAKVPVIIHNGTDPGKQGDQTENTLDVEMVGAAAPGANVTLVVSADTSTTPGFELSIQYIISKQTASIMSASYGSCELELGNTGNTFFNTLYQQGATEGISIFISSGDQGSAGCDHHQSTPDEIGLAVNGMASSAYVTAVGGTDFTWSFGSAPLSTYWNSTTNADGATAKGYIPEVPWNSTCANPLLLGIFTNSDGSAEFANSEALCNEAAQTSGYEGLVGIGAGSGGVSNCTAPTGTTISTCTGGHAKPTWQTGTGVPADGKRDLPDLSMFSSNWTSGNIVGSAILFCNATTSSNSCDYSSPDYIVYQEIGGTSAASPYMAGVMALVLQKAGGAKQGLANPSFYKLAAKDTLASCKSSTVKSGNTCVFYDQTSGTIAQACNSGGPDCTTNISGDSIGILSGYAATTGYDRATGLGSVNVANLVNEWSSVAPTPTVTLAPSTLTFASTKVGSVSATQMVTVKNTGTVAVALTSGGITFTGTDASSFEKTATTCGTSLAVGASCTVTVALKPATTGSLTAKLSVTDNATGSPQTVSLTGSGATAALTVTLSATALTFPNTVTGTTSDEQAVNIKNSGSSTVTLSAIALSGTNATSFVDLKTCGSTLAAGASCSVYVAFKPAANGALTATLSITDTATGSPQTVTLKGTGTGTPSVKLSAATLTFPTTSHGTTSAAVPLTLTNSGTAILDLTSIKLAGTSPTDFVELDNCGATLAASASCTVFIAFKPAAASAYKATVSIVDSGTASPQSVTLSGTGK